MIELATDPNLHPPSKPQKTQITPADREREEQELQMALALSIKDKSETPKANNQPQANASSGVKATPAPAQGTTAATVSRVRALFDFTPSEPGELAFRKGDIIAVLESVYKDWWKGSLRGSTGIFPLNYVEKLQDPTKEELEREAEMEAEVFGQIGNVEKLLALLSTSSREIGDVKENEEMTVSDDAAACRWSWHIFSHGISLTLVADSLSLNSCDQTEAHRADWQILAKEGRLYATQRKVH